MRITMSQRDSLFGEDQNILGLYQGVIKLPTQLSEGVVVHTNMPWGINSTNYNGNWGEPWKSVVRGAKGKSKGQVSFFSPNMSESDSNIVKDMLPLEKLWEIATADENKGMEITMEIGSDEIVTIVSRKQKITIDNAAIAARAHAASSRMQTRQPTVPSSTEKKSGKTIDSKLKSQLMSK